MKDYYAILGVVPAAEDIVIKAAYKALAQRYHPDRNPDSSEATAKMAEINEAYSVLSDLVKRKEYDKARGGKEGDFGDWVHEEEAEQASNSSDPLEKDWGLAVGFYPDLVEINNRLSKISHMLAFTYRAGLLDMKAFEKRKELAQVLENNFLQTYFGSNPEIIAFTRELILKGNRAATKALNDSIRVLGPEVPARIIINKICKDFNFETAEKRKQREAQVWAEKEEERRRKRMDQEPVREWDGEALPDNIMESWGPFVWAIAILLLAVLLIAIFSQRRMG